MRRRQSQLFAELAYEQLREIFLLVSAFLHPPLAVNELPALFEAAGVGKLRRP